MAKSKTRSIDQEPTVTGDYAIYRGYTIKKLLEGFDLSKESFSIGFAASFEQGKKIIDEVLG